MVKEKPIKLLLVDDEVKNVQLLAEILKGEGFLCQIAASYEEANNLLVNEQFSLGIFDLVMPTLESGLMLIRETALNYPDVGIIVLSAYGEDEESVQQAFEAGADIFLDKVFDDKKKLLNTIRSTIEKVAYRKKNIYQRDSIIGDISKDGIIGNCKAIRELKEKIIQSSGQSMAKYIYGESGTGKELVARAIHHYSARRDFPFVYFNCSAIVETLIESELFGHIKGAFTGADNDKKGFFELADGGTLFIDELGDMSINMQAKVLRAIENREFNRVGSENVIKVDIQIITASNKNLEKMVGDAAFRKDLFYRIRQDCFCLPPLRDRKEDIPLLVEYFISTYAKERRCQKKNLSKKALGFIINYDFPGNIRELRNIVERALENSQDDEIEMEDLEVLPFNDPEQHNIPIGYFEKPFNEAVGQFEKIYLKNLLKETKGNILLASRKAGIARTVLYDKLEKYKINSKSFKY